MYHNYIDSYESLAFKTVQKHEKNTQGVRDFSCVTNNLGGGYPVFSSKRLGLGLRNLLQTLNLAHLGPAVIFLNANGPPF